MPEPTARVAWSSPGVCPDEPEYLRPKRIGRFLVSLELIETAPGDVLRLLEGCIVVRAEVLFMPRSVEYCALCEAFDEIEPGPDIPLYKPVIRQRDGEDWTVSWQRVGPAD